MKVFLQYLRSSESLERAFDYLELKRRKLGFAEKRTEYLSADFLLQKRRYFKAAYYRVIEQVERGESPAVRTTMVETDGKVRELFKMDPVLLALHAVAGKLLSEINEAQLNENVWSYRRRRSPLLAVRHLRQAVRSIAIESGKKDLFLVKRDIKKFGDEIPLFGKSHLKSRLAEELKGFGFVDFSEGAKFLFNLVRCPSTRGHEIEQGQPIQFCRLKGLPTGSPIGPPILNMYLKPLDDWASGHKSAFYLRFGDDFVFLTSDFSMADEYVNRLPQKIETLGLHLNIEKGRNQVFNFSGYCPPQLTSSGWKASQSIDFLGLRLTRSGSIGLPPKKIKQFTRDIVGRVRLACGADQARDIIDLLVSQIFVDGFDESSGCAFAQLSALLHEVDDRQLLKQIDLRVWQQLERFLLKQKIFNKQQRINPYELRDRFAIRSLVSMRNRS